METNPASGFGDGEPGRHLGRLGWQQLLAYARDLSSTFAQLRETQGRLQALYLSTLTALASAIEARDRYLVGHSRSVAMHASGVGRELGLPEGQLETLQRAALLHDIGKIGVADQVLMKAGPLDADEWQQMRRHPELSYQILSGLDFLGEALLGVRHHHERYDGRGYPLGLAGDEIPYVARILSVCDAADAMLSDRPYRRGMAPAEVVSELRRGCGSQFDPSVAGLLAEMADVPGEEDDGP